MIDCGLNSLFISFKLIKPLHLSANAQAKNAALDGALEENHIHILGHLP